MNAIKQLDVRGLSCPEPAMRTRMILNSMQTGTVEVLVDSGTAQDNITRLAQHTGWIVKPEKTSKTETKLILTK